jgi:DNA-binding FadR family transcriptional regulator
MAPGGLHNRLVEELGSEIVRGVSDPAALQTESIESRFKVSRSVVREALRVLESKGLITSAPRRGISIAPVSEWQLLDSDLIRWRADSPAGRTHLAELVELRLGIEPLAAMLAALRHDTGANAELSIAFGELEKAMTARDFDMFARVDAEFHRCLLRASGNALIASMQDTLSAALEARASIVSLPEDMSSEALELHRRLHDAVVGGRSDEARQSAHAIVDASYIEVQRAFERRDNH